jgi:hypothetical protein
MMLWMSLRMVAAMAATARRLWIRMCRFRPRSLARPWHILLPLLLLSLLLLRKRRCLLLLRPRRLRLRRCLFLWRC